MADTLLPPVTADTTLALGLFTSPQSAANEAATGTLSSGKNDVAHLVPVTLSDPLKVKGSSADGYMTPGVSVRGILAFDIPAVVVPPESTRPVGGQVWPRGTR